MTTTPIDRARAALAQQHVSQPYKLPEPVAPTDDELIEIARELRRTAPYLQLGCGWDRALRAIESAANLIEADLFRRLTPPTEPPPLKPKRSGGYQHFRPKSLSPEALEAWDAAEANIEASMKRVKKLTEDLSPEPPHL